MICVWYIPEKDLYYAKILRHFMDKDLQVGKINNYGHELVCMFYIENHKNLIQCNDYWDYMRYKRKYKPSFYNYVELQKFNEETRQEKEDRLEKIELLCNEILNAVKNGE